MALLPREYLPLRSGLAHRGMLIAHQVSPGTLLSGAQFLPHTICVPPVPFPLLGCPPPSVKRELLYPCVPGPTAPGTLSLSYHDPGSPIRR